MAASETSSNGSLLTASTEDEVESRIIPGGPNLVLSPFIIPARRRIVAVDPVVKLDEWRKGGPLAPTSAIAQVLVINIITMQ